MDQLRQAIVRLATEVPVLRKHLVPLLRQAADKGVALYKGRTYRVLFLGPTKFGERARLQFMDGSKDFWVDAALVQKTNPPPRSCPVPARRNPNRKYECEECGEFVFPGTSCWETGCIH
jgi:hypothetical protein